MPPELIGALREIGPIGIALIILLIMWILNRQTTKGYRDEIARINADHDAELEELRKTRGEDIQKLREEITGLKEEIRSLRLEMEQERQARRQAEELAHRLRLGRGDPDGR